MPGTVDRASILSIHRRIRSHIRETPIVTVDAAELGVAVTRGSCAPITLKLEHIQHAGSFKARGAFANLLGRDVPQAGVAAASGGNHGAAVAFAAAKLGIPATIFVPEISSPAKQARIRATGSRLEVGGARYADALSRCNDFVSETGAVPIHAYDDALTLLGQGTLAIEWNAQAPRLDTLLIAVGGGGLIGGMAAWCEGAPRIVAVEPELSCALHAARSAGEPVPVDVGGVAADSLGARSVGRIMFPLAERHVDEVVLVPDDAILEAQRILWQTMRLAVEPGGATALAALITSVYAPEPDEHVGVLLCGGNVDPAMLA